jgi:hypothetical protein
MVREGNRLVHKRTAAAVKGPFAPPSLPMTGKKPATGNTAIKVVATVGWWELVQPSTENVARLCQQLHKRSIQLCAVTGFPAATAQPDDLNGKHGYTWIGDARSDYEAAGFFIEARLASLAQRVADPSGPSPRRCLIHVDGRGWQAAYGPYVGKFDKECHSSFLRQCVFNHMNFIRSGLCVSAWSMGDFNLRGVAEGSSLVSRSALHADLAKYFRAVLQESSLRVLPTGATHTKGGALDLHISHDLPAGGAEVVWLPRKLSDHALSIAKPQVPNKSKNGAEPQFNLFRRVVWSRDPNKWKQTLRGYEGAMKVLADACWEAAHGTVTETVSTANRSAMMEGATVCYHAITVSAGHEGSATELRDSRPDERVKQRAARRLQAAALLADANATYKEAKEASERSPGCQTKRALVDYEWEWLQAARKRLKSAPGGIIDSSFAKACRQGNTAVQKWLTRASSEVPPSLPLATPQQVHSFLDFRGQVGALDKRCDDESDKHCWRHVERLRRDKRMSVSGGCVPPVAIAGPEDEGPAAIFFAPATIQRLLKKRPSKKGASKLPVAMQVGGADSDAFVLMTTAIADLVWASADIDTCNLIVEMVNSYKGRGKDPMSPGSFRFLGMAEPLLSLISDLLFLRVGHQVTAFVGASQLGGLKDARWHAIVCRELTLRRRLMGLPTLDLQTDARFGYDGGRHHQVLSQLHQAGINQREWLLVDALFRKFAMRTRNGSGFLLPAVPHLKGGMIQGLGISGCLYSTLPRRLEEFYQAVVPPPAMDIHPAALQAYHTISDGTLSLADTFSAEHVSRLVQPARMVLDRLKADVVTMTQARESLRCIMRQCSSDSERLLLLDALDDFEGQGAFLFIDDAKLRCSSLHALVRVNAAADTYARCTGIVYETGLAGKSTNILDGVPADLMTESHAVLAETIQGGSPHITGPGSSTTFVGVAVAPGCSEADLTLRRLESKAAGMTRSVCVRATCRHWPLFARKFALDRAPAMLAYLLPLTVETRTAPLRLRSLQNRLVHAVLYGLLDGYRPPIPQDALRRCLADLGWLPLWVDAVVSAIMLYQRLLLEPDCFVHSRLAHWENSPKGCWFDRVRTLMSKCRIQRLDMQPSEAMGLSPAALKRILKRHRLEVVLPKVLARFGGHTPIHQPLPWPAIAAICSSPRLASAFEKWWKLRCLRVGPEMTMISPELLTRPLNESDLLIKLYLTEACS